MYENKYYFDSPLLFLEGFQFISILSRQSVLILSLQPAQLPQVYCGEHINDINPVPLPHPQTPHCRMSRPEYQ